MLKRFELTKTQGEQYIGSLFRGGTLSRPIIIIRLLDINEKGVCLWEQLPTFLIPSERDPNQSLEGIVVFDYVVENNDDDSFPLPPKRRGKLIRLPTNPSIHNSWVTETPPFLKMGKMNMWLTEQGVVHSFPARGCTPWVRTQRGKDLGLPILVPKQRKDCYEKIFHDYFNFEKK